MSIVKLLWNEVKAKEMKCNLLIQPKIFNVFHGHLELELHTVRFVIWNYSIKGRSRTEWCSTDGIEISVTDGHAYKEINLIKDRYSFN